MPSWNLKYIICYKIGILDALWWDKNFCKIPFYENHTVQNFRLLHLCVIHPETEQKLTGSQICNKITTRSNKFQLNGYLIGIFVLKNIFWIDLSGWLTQFSAQKMLRAHFHLTEKCFAPLHRKFKFVLYPVSAEAKLFRTLFILGWTFHTRNFLACFISFNQLASYSFFSNWPQHSCKCPMMEEKIV